MFIFQRSAKRPHLHSFPTRRSSDLKIGPSIMSGSALFLFGAPGNGKTAVAERISRVLSDPIYIPHALEVDGTVVKDRKSTRLNSSHVKISYAVFCLKKKNRIH